MASARPYPPSAQRLAAARASGHLPRPALVATASAFVVIACLVAGFGTLALEALVALLRDTLALVARGEIDTALRELVDFLGALSSVVALGLCALAAVIAVTIALARGSFAVARRSLQSFPKLTESRAAPWLWSLALALATALALADLWLLQPQDVPALARRWAGSAALFVVAAAIADVGFARARFYRSLWMTRAELRDEQRAAFGAPELREARRLARADSPSSESA